MPVRGPGNWISEAASEKIALVTNNAIFFGNLNSEGASEMPVRGSGNWISEVASEIPVRGSGNWISEVASESEFLK